MTDKPREFTGEAVPGQKPLLAEPPCDCHPRIMRGFMRRVMGKAAPIGLELCPLATATALVVIAAALVNPASLGIKDANKARCRDYAHRFADVLEIIAMRVKERADN